MISKQPGKVYTVVTYRSVYDEQALAAYGALAGPAITAGGGRIIARGMPLNVFEAGLEQRTIVIEWESRQQAEAIYSSEAYLAALAVLGNAAVRDIRIIAGV